MSSYGVGQGMAQGVQSLIPMAMNKMRMDNQNKMFDRQMMANDIWARGLAQAGLPFDQVTNADPSAIPESANMEQPSQAGRLQVPGQQIAIPQLPRQSMPSPTPRPSPVQSDAALLAAPPGIRRPSIRRTY